LRIRFTKLRPIQNFANYKEKEMPEFRKLITALATATLFAGLASAQVGSGAGGGVGAGNLSAGLPFTCGVTNGAVTPTLRAEGYTELTGDIVIVCSGGSPLATGTQIPTANITLFLNTTVTSRLLPTTASTTASEAILIVDEAGSALNGYGPSLPQSFCGNATVGAGAGGCTEFVGSSTFPNGTAGGVPVAGAANSTTIGANVFQGVTSGNQVTFYGIPVMAPVSVGDTRVFRITNVRVNANGVVAGGATPGSVTASLSINSSTSLAITNSTLTVGFVQQGLSASGTILRSNTSTGSTSNGSLAQCSSVSVTSTTSTAAGMGVLQFQENFATAFKVRQSGTLQNVPGTIYNSESGFIAPYVTNASSTLGTTSTAGLADFGTRLKATFNNVPAGVSLYVSTRDVINDFNAGNTVGFAGPQAQLVVSEAASDGPSGQAPALAAQTSTFGVVNGTAVPYAPVAINAATGSGLAVWEIVNTNQAQIDTVGFALYINYSANAAANSPAPGTISVTLSFAPTPSGGAFTSTTGAAASSTLPIPRFSDSLDITKSVATINLCTTPMLFPYVINVNGFDTGLAIANTTTDPFGTAAQAGSCSLYFYGSSAPTTIPFVTPTIATGTVYANLASTLAPGFSGYMIANCNFQLAHGFAFVSDVGARNLAMGYLALIFPSTGRSATEALNN
jgi:hypothetical protein